VKVTGVEVDEDELTFLLFLGLDKSERIRLATAGVVPPDGTSTRLAAKGLVVRIAIDPRKYDGEPGRVFEANAQGGMAVVELTGRGRQAILELGSTRRVPLG
jgi:hypothetical protein